MLLIYNVHSSNSIYVLYNLKIDACRVNDPPFLHLKISGTKAEAYSITETDLWYGL